jgi:hypothetical protein
MALKLFALGRPSLDDANAGKVKAIKTALAAG